MPEKKGDLSEVSYTLGIASIVFAFFQPLAGLILGIISLIQSKKQNTPMSEKAKKYSTIGIALSAIVFVVSLVVVFMLARTNYLADFPLA